VPAFRKHTYQCRSTVCAASAGWATGPLGCWAVRLGSACLLIGLACTPAAFFNNTISLGGDVPGRRGNVNVAFINNTPFRAIFTFGTYDPQNPLFVPQFDQFTAGPNAADRLEGNTDSQVFTFQCGRAMSIGGDELIQRIREEGLGTDADQAALEPGITFSDRPLDDPDADQPTAGRAVGVVTLQGYEYRCESLLVYTFELDPTQPGGFRIDLNVILP
jgi:hypothetical protein